MASILKLLSSTYIAAALLFFQSASAFAAGDYSFLLTKLLKPTTIEVTLSDLNHQSSLLKIPRGRLSSDSGYQARLDALRGYPISGIIAAPGHRVLRKPEQVLGLVDYIQSSAGGNFVHDKLLINIVTDSSGKIISVDLWNAHHRMLAYLRAGYHTIDDLNPQNVEILLNGKTVHGERWTHYLPSAGVDIDAFQHYQAVPPGGEIRVGTIAVSGQISNFTLGSRNTIGQLYKNTFSGRKPKVGVYFGTFDPIHEGHIEVVKQAIREFGLDEVVIAPNLNTPHKPGASEAAHRLKMTAIRVQSESKINLYMGDSARIINQFGRDPFIERIGQTYGTKEIYQIIGEDSYRKLVTEGAITSKSNRRYIVSRRPGMSGEIPVPEDLQEVVSISQRFDMPDLSSTTIRNKLISGQPVPENELHPKVLLYIKLNRLYRN